MDFLKTSYLSDESDNDSETIDSAEEFQQTRGSEHDTGIDKVQTSLTVTDDEVKVKRNVTKQPQVDVTEDGKSYQKLDFFGLEVTESDDNGDEKEYNNISGTHTATGKQTEVMLQSKPVGVEIPSSSFWAELDVSQLQTYQTAGKDNKRKIEPPQKPSHRQGRPLETLEHSVAKIGKSNQRPSLEPQLEEKSYSCTKHTRKLFYVHSKIKPSLHHHGNRDMAAPSVQEWTKPAHAGAINRIKWNIPEYSHLLATCSMDSTVKIWNIWTQLDPCLSVLRVHDKAVRDIDWEKTGKQLLSCSFDRTAKVTDVEKGVAVHSLSHHSHVTCGKFHPGRPYCCVTGEKDRVQVWDIRTPQSAWRAFEFKDPMGQVQDVTFSPDQSTLFTCTDLISRDSSDRNLIAWDFDTGAPVSNQIYQERYTLTRLKMHPSDRTMLAQSYGNYIAIFNLDRPYKMYRNKRFEGHKLLGYSVGFDVSKDGRNVYSGSSDGTIHCYNYQSGKRFKTLTTGMNVVMDIQSHPVLPSTLAACGWDGVVEIWR